MHDVPVRGDNLKAAECFRLYMRKEAPGVYRTLRFCPCADPTDRKDTDTIPVMCWVKGSERKERIK